MLQVPGTAIWVEAALGLRSAVEQCMPTTAQELAQTLVVARDSGKAVVPWGGGTEQDLGSPPRRADLIVHTRGLAGVISYAPEDLTLSVHAGTSLAEIDAVLATHRQFLPLELPQPDRATIGGVVATAALPVRRFRYGGARDLVIGLEVALPDGARCKSGGRVVKNVAGYDLCKLFTGSLGTLGILTVVNVKVQPLPAAQALVVGSFGGRETALRAGAWLARGGLGFGGMIVERGEQNADWTLKVLAEGFPGTMARQVQVAKEAISHEGGHVEVVEGPEAARAAIAELAAWRVRRDNTAILLRGAVAPVRLSTAIGSVEKVFDGVLGTALQGDAGTGTFFVQGIAAASSLEAVTQAIGALRAEIVALGGNLVVAGGTVALRTACDPWGAPAQAERLARTIKQRIDPDTTLNPGRFAYGI